MKEMNRMAVSKPFLKIMLKLDGGHIQKMKLAVECRH
jgi:hypothetical protein